MARALRVSISPEEIIEAVKDMKKRREKRFWRTFSQPLRQNIWKASQRRGKTTNPGE